jgi:DNA-binding MarR family transcriptional regulator
MISKAKATEVQELFSKLKRVTNWTSEKRARAPLQLSSTQARLLLYAAEHHGVSQAELATATDTDKALAGRVIESLIERGWLRRDRSSEDARAYIVSLSASGRKVATQLNHIGSDIVNKISQTLDDKDVEDFKRIANKLIDATMSD